MVPHFWASTYNMCRVQRCFVAVSLNEFCFNIFRCGDETPGSTSAGKILLVHQCNQFCTAQHSVALTLERNHTDLKLTWQLLSCCIIIRLLPLPSTSFSIHFPLIILPVSTVSSEVLTPLLNEPKISKWKCMHDIVTCMNEHDCRRVLD
jgi:hypothetical protein